MADSQTYEVKVTIAPLNPGFGNHVWYKFLEKYATCVDVITSTECKTITWRLHEFYRPIWILVRWK
jgi:hypothetical protein